MSPIRVLVADAHPLFAHGLVRALGNAGGMTVVGTVTGGRDAMAGIRSHRPDVAVLDVSMPGLTGIEVTQEVAREGLGTHVLLLSALVDEALVLEAMASGEQAIC